MPSQLAAKPALPLPIRLRADISATGKGVTIAMVDSDFRSHPDLIKPTNRILRYVDAVNNEVHDAPPAGNARARQWHGTMTACTAAGNGYLSQNVFTSLAPSASLVLIRTMNDEGRVTTEAIVNALTYIKNHAKKLNIRVANLSVYDDDLDQTISHPVNKGVEDLVKAGIVVVCAAGNNPNAPVRPPAAAPSGLAVGGLDDKNNLRDEDVEMYHSTFGVTSIGVQKPDVIAPAVWLPAPILLGTDQHKEAAALCAMDNCTDAMLQDIAPRLLPHTKLPFSVWTSRNIRELRTSIRERIEAELIVAPYYKMVDGTSFSAPIVASIVAQMLEIDPELTPDRVKSILKDTARPLNDRPSVAQGAGMVQQRAAIAAVRDGVAASAP